jgi:3-hydroxybutyryl-CoA dehydrogenase
MTNTERVLVVGTGTMGCGIATALAKAGYGVVLYGRREEGRRQAIEKIAANLKGLVDFKALRSDDIAPSLARVVTTGDLDGAAADSTFIIESVAENLELKRELWGNLDKIAPADAILASNSTSLTLAELGTNVVHRDRFLATHFYNPAYLIPLVEIATTPQTAEWAFQKAYRLMEEIGKVPVRCADSSGYIGSRLQLPMVMEAVNMVQKGIATAEDIDKAIRNSWGPRVAAMGPLEMADRGGLDIWLLSGDNFAKIHGDPKFGGPDLLREMVGRGELGAKTGRGLHGDSSKLLAEGRDRRLIGLLQYLGALPTVDEAAD